MHDFCFTIPYGLILVVGGLFGYAKKGSTASLAGGLGTGFLLILAGFVSLKAFQKRRNSYFSMVLETVCAFTLTWVMGQRYIQTSKIMPAGIVAVISSRGEVILTSSIALLGGSSRVAEASAIHAGLGVALDQQFTHSEVEFDAKEIVDVVYDRTPLVHNELWPILEDIRILRQGCGEIIFQHVSRNANSFAHDLAQCGLNESLSCNGQYLDLLPLLPMELSWPLLNSLRSPIDILPTFVGSASSPNDTLEWKGACFYKNRAWMEFHNKSGSEFGGGTLHIKARAK
ncbi:hypothetical protein HHK36_003254 [Tetracentron sinense]|uniref:RNase H type-1 domain-containing protein n=1 Tax=Tetracentron sinense TaxID=13715 RepID=A0A835DSA3_TETSI|nr:hypothetical protein HHK36_003254 [Tetracentron sinense]